MNVLVVDDHAVFRLGLKSLLASLQQIVNVYEADTLSDALTCLSSSPIDLVLLDLALDDSQGEATISAIKAKHDRVVIISGEPDPRLIMNAMQNGIAGFLPKLSSPQVMLSAIKLILNGGTYIPPEILSLLASNNPPPTIASDHLTKKQNEVLQLMLKGLSNKVIAHELSISEGTVKAHLSAVYKTLGVTSRSELILSLSRAS